MRELRLTDGELQALIAPAISARLKQAGFRVGTPSDDLAAFWFPIDLQVAGAVSIKRTDDGVWTFTQDEDVIAERLSESHIAFAEAVGNRADRPS